MCVAVLSMCVSVLSVSGRPACERVCGYLVIFVCLYGHALVQLYGDDFLCISPTHAHDHLSARRNSSHDDGAPQKVMGCVLASRTYRIHDDVKYTTNVIASSQISQHIWCV